MENPERITLEVQNWTAHFLMVIWLANKMVLIQALGPRGPFCRNLTYFQVIHWQL